jgi:hypothetical protein
VTKVAEGGGDGGIGAPPQSSITEKDVPFSVKILATGTLFKLDIAIKQLQQMKHLG